MVLLWQVKVKFDIIKGLLRYGFLLKFNTFHMSRSNLTSLMDASDAVSYWCSIHFICLSCFNKVLQATELWWCCIWPWPLGQGQIWNHQWIPQMWFPINVLYISYVYLAPIRCYRLLLLFSMYFLWGAIWPWFDLLEILVTYFSSYICRS